MKIGDGNNKEKLAGNKEDIPKKKINLKQADKALKSEKIGYKNADTLYD